MVVEDEWDAGGIGQRADERGEGEDVGGEEILGADLQDVHAAGDHLAGGCGGSRGRDVAEVEDAVEPAVGERLHGK